VLCLEKLVGDNAVAVIVVAGDLLYIKRPVM
jgi:hypothetical protein